MRDEIERFARLLGVGPQVHEVRVFSGGKVAFVGYFDDPERLAELVAEEPEAGAYYVTLNALHPEFLARSPNAFARAATGESAKDTEIAAVRWLLIDVDPVRDTGLCSTDTELTSARALGDRIEADVRDAIGAVPMRTMSGNGVGLLYHLEPVGGVGRVAGILRLLHDRYSSDTVKIDTSVGNPSRITRLCGTMNVKRSAPDRPQRRSVLEYPATEPPSPVAIERFERWLETGRIAERVRQRLRSTAGKHKDKIRRLLAGEIVAEDNADDAMTIVTMAVAGAALDLKYDKVQIPELVEIFRPSYAAWSTRPGAEKSLDQELAKVQAKLATAFDKASPVRPTVSPRTLRDGGVNGGGKVSQVTELLELVQGLTLFRSPDGTAYADMPPCAVPVGSSAFRDYLIGEYYGTKHKAPAEKSVRDAVATIAAKARVDGVQRSVHVRVAGFEGDRYVDPADDTGRAIQIGSDGWQVVPRPAISFVRPAGLRPLPAPAAGGSLDELRALINVGDDRQWALTLSWLLFVLVGDGPYPLLCVHGEQGSAKSTFTRTIRDLVDPHAASLRTLPDNLRDLAVAANGSYVLAFDNVSMVKQEVSDALCQLATGGSFAARKLYTDAEEQIFTAKRPVILNGIEEVGRRSDLLERSIILTLPTIPEEGRCTEAEFKAAWIERYAGILGALLDAAVATLRELPSVRPERLQRMADFGRFALAVEKALGLAEGTVASALSDNAARMHSVALEQSPIYAALLLVLERGGFEGTVGALLDALNSVALRKCLEKPPNWPKDATRLSGMLNRMAPNLRADGLEVTFPPRTSVGRRVKIAAVGRRAA